LSVQAFDEALYTNLFMVIIKHAKFWGISIWHVWRVACTNCL